MSTAGCDLGQPVPEGPLMSLRMYLAPEGTSGTRPKTLRGKGKGPGGVLRP